MTPYDRHPGLQAGMCLPGLACQSQMGEGLDYFSLVEGVVCTQHVCKALQAHIYSWLAYYAETCSEKKLLMIKSIFATSIATETIYGNCITEPSPHKNGTLVSLLYRYKQKCWWNFWLHEITSPNKHCAKYMRLCHQTNIVPNSLPMTQQH